MSLIFKGVRYIIDRFKGNCSYTTLDPDSPEADISGGYIVMKNTTGFFDFESSPFQYTGQVILLKKNFLIFNIFVYLHDFLMQRIVDHINTGK